MNNRRKGKQISTGQKPISSQSQHSFSISPSPSLSSIIVTLLAFALYANTLSNQFALDDGMVLRDNQLVLKGIGAIPDILSHDSFYGSLGDSKNLAGGRYRPLSLVSFAIEVSLFGENTLIHHLINILLYTLTALVILNFLRRFIFPMQPLAAIIATLLFVFHPIHTEVVANIKSRDEILSLLFLVITLNFLLRYVKESRRTAHLMVSLLCYFLALLSKENGLIFVIMVPLTIYFLTGEKIKGIISLSLPFIAVAACYLLIRIALLGIRNYEVTEILDNPYILAAASQKYATILFVFLKYVQLLFFPYPLTYDYSYRQIPYREFSDPLVWLSLMICFLLGIFALLGFKKKDILSWCTIFFLGTLFIVSNVIFNIGTPMAERFLYQASLPFAIAMVEVGKRISLLIALPRKIYFPLAFILLTAIPGIFTYAIIQRNTTWKSDQTLFLHDVNISTESARANMFAGIACITASDERKDSPEKREYLIKALNYFKKAEAIRPDYIQTFLNEGVAYSRIDSVDAAETTWNRARAIDPGNSKFKEYDNYLSRRFYQRGMKEGAEKNFFASVIDLEKAVKYDPANSEAWYNLGGAYFTIKNFDKASMAWEKTLQLNPQHPGAIEGLGVVKELQQ